jgi:hypothetical protein
MAEFAVWLLDWARSVIAVRESPSSWSFDAVAAARIPLEDIAVALWAIVDSNGQVRRWCSTTPCPACDVLFWSMRHEQQSDLPVQFGCARTFDDCVAVDDEARRRFGGCTSPAT